MYALFYTGPLPYYASIRDMDVPIYVGSAIPFQYDAKTAREQGVSLSSWLGEHHRDEARPEGNEYRYAFRRIRYCSAASSRTEAGTFLLCATGDISILP